MASEAADGDPDAAQLRLSALVDLPEVELPLEAMARALVEPGPIPAKAALDAFHIAAAVVGGADYLLTWNFKHLANAALRKRIEAVCRSSGYDPPNHLHAGGVEPAMSLPAMNDEPIQDEIIAEVRAIRDALAARFGYDVERLFEEAKRRERGTDREQISPSPKRLSPASSA